MWSEGGWTGPNYAVAYAVGSSPFGPFTRIGRILQQDPAVATGAGHHSVFRGPRSGKWYIAYHRRPLGETDRNHRVVPFYFVIGELTQRRATYLPELALDRAVSVQPAWMLVYGLLYVFVVILPLLVVRQPELSVTAATMCAGWHPRAKPSAHASGPS